MKSYYLIALLLLASQSSASLNLLQLNIDNLDDDSLLLPDPFINEPVVAGDTLIYLSDDSYLWANKGDGSDSYQILMNQNPILTSEIFSDGERVYFVSQEDLIYSTDGDSVVQVSDIPVMKITRSSDQSLVAKMRDNTDFLLLENNTTHRFYMGEMNVFENSGSLPNSYNMCVISSNKAVVLNFNDNFFYYYSDGGRTAIFERSISTEYVTQFGDACYYSERDENFNYKLFKVESREDAEYFNLNSIQSLNSFFSIEDRLFAFGSQPNSTTAHLYELVNDSNTPSLRKSFDSEYLYPYQVWSTDNHIFLYSRLPCGYSKKCSPVSPGVTQVVVLNTDFNIINKYYHDPSNVFYSFKSIGALDLLQIDGPTDQLVQFKNGESSEPLVNHNANLLSILGGQNGKYYIYGFDNQAQQKSVYILLSSPAVSHHLSGLWYSEDFNNQGLSLQTGVRRDGSEYIVSSFYTYKDGKPYWVTGVAELTHISSEISIDLYQYNGQSPFIDGALRDSDQTPFGVITIKALECQTIDAVIDLQSSSQTVSLQLKKITNTSNQLNCID